MRFGVNLLVCDSRAEWQDRCRRAEDLGYDVIAVPDHLGMPAPFPALVSAAEATSRPRLTVFALNAGFYNPVLLAREVSSTDQLVDGRLEIALGAGYVKEESDHIGLAWPTPGQRVDRLEESVGTLIRTLAEPEHRPRCVQRPRPPLALAGNGDRVLRLAAASADIVALSGAAPGGSPGRLRLLPTAGVEERIDLVREAVGDRPMPEINLLVHAVALDGDADRAVRSLRRFDVDPDLDPWDVPTVLHGPPGRVAERLRALEEDSGIGYLTVPEPAMEDFGAVIRELGR